MSAVSGNADTVEIDVVLRVTADDSQVEGQQQGEQTLPVTEADEDLAKDLLDTEEFTSLSDSVEKFDNFLGGLDRNGIQNLKSFATNPQGTIENQLLSALGTAGVYGALAVTIISLVISSPEVFKAIVKFLGQKGGPLNQDYRRDFDGEVQLGIDRDLQFRRAAGLDVIITNQDRNFILDDPSFVNNSLVHVEVTRYDRISNNERQWGYSDSP
jgi:hypothetical protein